MDPLGLPIFWLSILVGETKGPEPIQTGVVNLGDILKVFPSRGFVLSVSFQFTTVGSLKIHAPLRVASVTISLELIVWRACKFPLISATPPEIRGAGGMKTGMISGTIRLINNFCGEFPLVVSLSLTFLFFPSLF